jgi:general secretion pathway protein G
MRRSDAGVTLIGALAVVAIIALFLMWATADRVVNLDKAKVVGARVQIESFKNSVTQYKISTGLFPTTKQGLDALWTKPASVNGWEGPYLREEIPLDPWGHPYVYKYPGEHGSQPDIVSYGADGQPGGEGPNADIVSWKN